MGKHSLSMHQKILWLLCVHQTLIKTVILTTSTKKTIKLGYNSNCLWPSPKEKDIKRLSTQLANKWWRKEKNLRLCEQRRKTLFVMPFPIWQKFAAVTNNTAIWCPLRVLLTTALHRCLMRFARKLSNFFAENREMWCLIAMRSLRASLYALLVVSVY